MPSWPTHRAPDVLSDPAATVAPYRLERDGLTAALVFDTPGVDTDGLPPKALDRLATLADLVIWVTAAHRPDRQVEREALDRIRAGWTARPDRHPPPLLVAASHIDLLRPPREWQPPYDLVHPQGHKAANIRAAITAVAEDLAVPVAEVIPVCLAEGRVYNVEDSLWVTLLDPRPRRTRSDSCVAWTGANAPTTGRCLGANWRAPAACWRSYRGG